MKRAELVGLIFPDMSFIEARPSNRGGLGKGGSECKQLK